MSLLEIDASVKKAFESDPVLERFLFNVLNRKFEGCDGYRPFFIRYLFSFTLAVLSEQVTEIRQWCLGVVGKPAVQDLFDFQAQFIALRMKSLGDQYDDSMSRARYVVRRLELAHECRRIAVTRTYAYGFHSCVSSAAKALCMLKLAPSDSCYPARFKLRGLEFQRKLPVDAILDCVQRLPVTLKDWEMERRFAKAVYDDEKRPSLRECILTFACSPSELVDAWPEIGSVTARTRARLVQWLSRGVRLTAQEFTHLLLRLLVM